jgi:3-phenylpropionate/cinnamic acid dioxygenase small subunit
VDGDREPAPVAPDVRVGRVRYAAAIGERDELRAPDDVDQIRRTLASYCHHCDDGRFDEWQELFTDDATFLVMGRRHQGRPAIRAFIEAGQPPERRGKHVCANSVIDVNGDTATARTDYIFVGRTPDGLAVTSAGRYYDTLVRQEHLWLFRSREIVFMGDEPTGA